MSALLLVFPGLAILCAPALWFILGRPKWLNKPTGKAAGDSRISVIIPARNEKQYTARQLSNFPKSPINSSSS